MIVPGLATNFASSIPPALKRTDWPATLPGSSVKLLSASHTSHFCASPAGALPVVPNDSNPSIQSNAMMIVLRAQRLDYDVFGIHPGVFRELAHGCDDFLFGHSSLFTARARGLPILLSAPIVY